MGCFTFWVLASFQLPCSQLHKLIFFLIFGVSLTWTKCIILTFSGTEWVLFYFIVVFFSFFFFYIRQKCLIWLTEDALDDLILPNHLIPDVLRAVMHLTSLPRWRVGFTLLSSCCPVSNTNTQDQTGGYEHVSHVVNWTKKQKKIISKVNWMELCKY